MEMQKPELLNRYRCHQGEVAYYRHRSSATQTDMKFSVFVPPQASTRKLPVLYWLSGLTCTEENFMVKAGAQRVAAELGILLVAPDTSPRGAGIEGEEKDWDLGTGAGFYVNSTQPKWAKHYQMDDYVTKELPSILAEWFPANMQRQSIFGHSMGGHGAMVLALRNPDQYQSVSAFSPICAPSLCPWGQKAFAAYLGDDPSTWGQYDANHLVTQTKKTIPIKIDQGEADNFLAEQLLPDIFESTCKSIGYPLDLRRRAGYDHSYYFIASFMDEHLKYHAGILNRF